MISQLYKRFMAYLEDPRYPSVGPHLRFLNFLGMWDADKNTILRYQIIHFYFIIIFFITIYIKIFFFDLTADNLKTILKYVPFHVGVLKAVTFRKDHLLWEKIVDYVSNIEHKQLALKDSKYEKIISSYLKYNRKISYFFWGSVICADFLIFTEPYQKNQIVENGTSIYINMFDGWTPFDKEPPGYYFSMIIQTIAGFTTSAYILAWDAFVVCIMVFFAGQLKIAKVTLANIIAQDSDATHQNVIDFHKYYIKLTRYQVMFNGMISPIMFLYLIVASINLGVCTIQIVALNEDLVALCWSCVYVMAILFQLLLFYWHSNEVTVQSQEVRYGLFECNWIGVEKKIQKEIVLLGLATNKRLVFMAGPFTEMSLYVFTAILRGTYSFYTLLNETN